MTKTIYIAILIAYKTKSLKNHLWTDQNKEECRAGDIATFSLSSSSKLKGLYFFYSPPRPTGCCYIICTV